MTLIKSNRGWFGHLLRLGNEDSKIWNWKQSRLRRFQEIPSIGCYMLNWL